LAAERRGQAEYGGCESIEHGETEVEVRYRVMRLRRKVKKGQKIRLAIACQKERANVLGPKGRMVAGGAFLERSGSGRGATRGGGE